MSSSFKVANLAIFGYEHFGGVGKSMRSFTASQLDQERVRIGLAILYPDLLDEPVRATSRTVGWSDSVLTRDLFQRNRTRRVRTA